MMVKIKHKLGKDCGMTVLETLISMFILMMVTVVVATGIPTAANAYSKVLDSANAQILLSTAMTKLRDELETADNIKVDGKAIDEMAEAEDELSGEKITYTTSSYGGSMIYRNQKSDHGHINAVRLWEYIIGEATDAAQDDAVSNNINRLLVSQKASNDNLYLTYDYITYKKGTNYITFEGLVVKKKDTDQTLAEPVDYSVKLLLKYN
jgi:ABC-type Na+ efflux pump permease subunit